MLSRPDGSELPMIVDQAEGLVLHMHQHGGQSITVHILEAQGDWSKLLPVAQQRRPVIDPGFGCISPRQFDNHHMAVQVERDEVARIGCAVVMPYDSIDLVSSPGAVMPSILRH